MNENETKYVEVDKNLIVEASIGDLPVEMYDVRRAPFAIYGAYDPLGEEWFVRLPDEVGAAVSAGVHRLSKETAGIRVRFSTDSEYVAIRA